MNIMFATKTNILLLLLAILIIPPTALYSSDSSDQYGIHASFSLGWSHKLNSYLNDSAGYSGDGLPLGLRLYWQPDHILNIGVETGYINISRYSRTKLYTQYGEVNAKAQLRAIPILLSFAVNKWHFEFNVAVGAYYLYVNIESDKYGLYQYSDEWNMGFMTSLNYFYKFSDYFRIGGGVKLYGISEKQDYLISPQIILDYRFFEW